jgi:hypothetical protein
MMLPASAILPPSHRYRALVPVRQGEWREPSLAQPKDQFGNQNRTRFRLVARLNDGHVRWRGWFDSREDADAFLHALARHVVLGEPMPRSLWELPTPAWHPAIGPHVTYDFATVQTLTSGAGSNQSWTSQSDWNNSDNTIQAIGAGASGGATRGSVAHDTGGGGGGCSGITNFAVDVPGTTTATWQVGVGGPQVSRTSNGSTVGTNGGDTWFNATTLAASSVGAKGGIGGAAGTGSRSGGAGGDAASGVGTTKTSGGRGGNLTGGSGGGGSGGGGAGGLNGDGSAGGDDSSTSSTKTDGGAGDAGNGGAGGSFTGGSATPPNYSGGGGGGASGVAATASAGGNYGGGGGGANAASASTCRSGAGIQGIIILTYTPPATIALGFNMPLMGL